MTILRELLPALSTESGVAVATVIANRSGLDFAPAARLAIRDDGSTMGAIHPDLDARLAEEARLRLESRRSGLLSFRVTSEQVEGVGIQGGDVDVYFEVLPRRPRLVIVGAGHIALPLARIASLLDFWVTVVDDRPELANRERFPDADELLIGDYRSTVAGLQLDRDSCVVLVTRGHVHDQACLEELLPGHAGYIGMIGSRRRVRTVLAHARDNGADPERLRRVYAPIGIDISALTPAEIAVAIMAEIVNIRRGGRAPSLALGERARV